MKKNLYLKMMAIIFGISLATFLVIRFYVMNSFREKLIRQVPKSAVDTAYSVIESVAKEYQEKKLTESAAQEQIKSIISNLRLDDGSYFGIHDLNLKMILHPIKTALNGTDLNNYKSPTGRLIFVEMNQAVAKENGRAWYNYYWPKPNEAVDKEKTSYLRVYNPWGWVIGSGMYVEDVEASMHDFFLKIEIIISLLFGTAIISGHFIAKKISEKLKDVAAEVNHTAMSFKETATETQKSIQSLAQISVEQASAIEETAASVHEIRSMAEQNSKNSEEALKFSDQNKKISLKGKEALTDLEVAIHDIEKSIENMNEEIENNNKKFEDIILVITEINNKTKVINDIVFQTKLLSFNASVEAARAGEHGKGFSVVAEEVGKLAAMSGDASKEINDLISSSAERISAIVTESKKILSSLNGETTAKVEKGQATSNEFSQIFDNIIQNIEKMSNSINEMSMASKEQGEGITQINMALNQLTDAGHQGMNSTENIKLQIESLYKGTENLDGSVKVLNKEIHG
ncbi:MAG: cache domain-containing protein [Bacteriovorax sp.]